MKKIIFTLVMIGLMSQTNIAFAGDFDNITGLTPVQKETLARIQGDYKLEYNQNETNIMQYTDKLKQIKEQKDITPEQASLLTSAYERNINVLKNRQNELKNETEAKYKEVFTDEQYKEYQMLQIKADNAFSDFLRK